MISSSFDHIAYATIDTNKTLGVFAILGFKQQLFYKEPIDKFGCYISKIQSEYGQVLEIVEPHSELNVVKRLLQDRKATIYHSAFFTPNLMDTLAQLKKAGVVIITEPMDIPYPISEAHRQYKASHVFHPNIGLFEVTGPLNGT